MIDADRLRITSWLVPETVALLSSPDIAAFVHHGGANSYFEACYTGVPQVILPVWYDTYVFAAKAEYHGIGVYGNKKSAPGANREEFTEALTKVMSDAAMREKAKATGEICRKSGGRETAYEKITEVARRSTKI